MKLVHRETVEFFRRNLQDQSKPHSQWAVCPSQCHHKQSDSRFFSRYDLNGWTPLSERNVFKQLHFFCPLDVWVDCSPTEEQIKNCHQTWIHSSRWSDSAHLPWRQDTCCPDLTSFWLFQASFPSSLLSFRPSIAQQSFSCALLMYDTLSSDLLCSGSCLRRQVSFASIPRRFARTCTSAIHISSVENLVWMPVLSQIACRHGARVSILAWDISSSSLRKFQLSERTTEPKLTDCCILHNAERVVLLHYVTFLKNLCWKSRYKKNTRAPCFTMKRHMESALQLTSTFRQSEPVVTEVQQGHCERSRDAACQHHIPPPPWRVTMPVLRLQQSSLCVSSAGHTSSRMNLSSNFLVAFLLPHGLRLIGLRIFLQSWRGLNNSSLETMSKPASIRRCAHALMERHDAAGPSWRWGRVVFFHHPNTISPCGPVSRELGTVHWWAPILLKRVFGISPIPRFRREHVPMLATYSGFTLNQKFVLVEAHIKRRRQGANFVGAPISSSHK